MRGIQFTADRITGHAAISSTPGPIKLRRISNEYQVIDEYTHQVIIGKHPDEEMDHDLEFIDYLTSNAVRNNAADIPGMRLTGRKAELLIELLHQINRLDLIESERELKLGHLLSMGLHLLNSRKSQAFRELVTEISRAEVISGTDDELIPPVPVNLEDGRWIILNNEQDEEHWICHHGRAIRRCKLD